MPKDKSETHQKVLAIAMKEFLAKGYTETSMREIAAEVGITAAGLYRHFTNKEALFAALVEPALIECRRLFKQVKEKDYTFLHEGNPDKMWAEENRVMMNEWVDILYAHFNEFKLLLCCSEGTSYANSRHEFVLLAERETLAYMQAAKQKGIPIQPILPEELHLLMTAYYDALFEVVIHDLTREQALHYIGTLLKFFIPGWRAVLGL